MQNLSAMSVCLVFVLVHFAFAEEAATDKSKLDRETLKAFYRQEAKDYGFTIDWWGKKRLKLEKPVLTWTGLDYQEDAGTQAPNSGEVYVWTYQGRAIVAGGVGSFPLERGRHVFHEFHALTETPPAAIKVRTPRPTKWSPKGVKLNPVPGAPLPSKASTPARVVAARRLTTMRNMAKQFRGETKSPDTGKVSKLKLQSQPLYRLDAAELKKANSHVIDGALFVFTNQLGTDPELTLLIECHKTKDGLKWMYAAGAFTYQELWLKHKDAEAWYMANYHKGPVDGNFFTDLTQYNVTMATIRGQLRKEQN